MVWGVQDTMTAQLILINPKFPHNVGGAVRAAACYDALSVTWTGKRVTLDATNKRLPREERLRAYRHIDMVINDRPFDALPPDVVPVAIEVRETSEQLPAFEHPEHAAYVFGPEDGSIPSVLLRHCHRFVIVPSLHCMNLAATVNVVLYDRLMKRQLAGLDPIVPTARVLDEQRGWEINPMDIDAQWA